MPQRGYEKTRTLESLLRRLKRENSDYYEQLDEYLSNNGYMVYTGKHDRLVVKLAGQGLSMKQLRSVIEAINSNLPLPESEDDNDQD